MPRALDERQIERLPGWVPGPLRAALLSAEGDAVDAALGAGRLMRSDDLDPGFGARLQGWVRAHLAGEAAAPVAARADAALAACEGGLAADPKPLGWAWEVVEARDDAESLLWVLGITGHPAEARLLARAEAVDRAGAAAMDGYVRDLWRAPGTDARAWILPLARSTEPCWWLDPLIFGRLREQVVGWLTRPLAGAAIRVAPMPARAADPEVATRFANLGEAALEAALQTAPEAPLARFGDGRVVVHAVGFAEDEDALPPGLLLVSAPDAPAVRSVRLEPQGLEAPRPLSGRRIFVPLAGLAGEHVLHLELEGEGEVRLTLRPPLGG